MSSLSNLQKTSSFELRSGTLDTLLFVVRDPDLDVLYTEIEQRFGATQSFFANEGVVIDVRALDANASISLPALVALLKQRHMCPIGVVAEDAQLAWVKSSGLPVLDAQESRGKRRDIPVARTARAVTQAKSSDSAAAIERTPASVSASLARMPAPSAQPTILDKPLRSGQQIYAPGDLIVLAPVNCGAEIMAQGNLYIYAPLRGRALAGVPGNTEARIFCSCLEAELVSIAGIYGTAEAALLMQRRGQSVQVRLVNEKLIIEPLSM